MEGTQPQGQKKTRHLPAHLLCSQPIFRTVNVSFIKISLYKCLLSTFQQGFTGSHNLVLKDGTRGVWSHWQPSLSRSLPVLYTDNYKKEVEGRWGTGMAWNHVRWTLGDNRQLLWSCGQIDWQVYKKCMGRSVSLQVHYQRMTSTSTLPNNDLHKYTCKRTYWHMLESRKSCLVWSLSVSDLH